MLTQFPAALTEKRKIMQNIYEEEAKDPYREAVNSLLLGKQFADMPVWEAVEELVDCIYAASG